LGVLLEYLKMHKTTNPKKDKFIVFRIPLQAVCRWEDNIKMNLQEVGEDSGD
jgi:hypothetical protein